MTKSEYSKVELELLLKGYELLTYKVSGPSCWRCFIRNIENRKITLDFEKPNELKILVGYTEKNVKRRMIDWYAKNRSVALLQHSA